MFIHLIEGLSLNNPSHIRKIVRVNIRCIPYSHRMLLPLPHSPPKKAFVQYIYLGMFWESLRSTLGKFKVSSGEVEGQIAEVIFTMCFSLVCLLLSRIGLRLNCFGLILG